jgi:hypothetical protein
MGNVSVRDVLEELSERRVRWMRERVGEMITRLVYASSSDGLGDGMEDALDVGTAWHAGAVPAALGEHGS